MSRQGTSRHAAVSGRGVDTFQDLVHLSRSSWNWLMRHLLCCDLLVSWAPWALSLQADALLVSGRARVARC